MTKQVGKSFTTLAIGFLIGVSAVELYHVETRPDMDETRDAGGDARALTTPPMAAKHENANEVLRVWTVKDGPNQFVIEPFWEDAGTWGILLADIARHSAIAHAQKYGGDSSLILSRIEELLVAELNRPTSQAQQIR